MKGIWKYGNMGGGHKKLRLEMHLGIMCMENCENE